MSYRLYAYLGSGGGQAVLNFSFFERDTAYELRISDWSADVCSSDRITDLPSPIFHLWTSPRRPGPPREPSHVRCHIAACRNAGAPSSDERRIGKKCISTCRSRRTPYNDKKKPDRHRRIPQQLRSSNASINRTHNIQLLCHSYL